jgi:hypothetical protein
VIISFAHETYKSHRVMVAPARANVHAFFLGLPRLRNGIPFTAAWSRIHCCARHRRLAISSMVFSRSLASAFFMLVSRFTTCHDKVLE